MEIGKKLVRKNIYYKLNKLVHNINSKKDAYNFYKGPLLSAIKQAIKIKNFGLALDLELYGYVNLIKKYAYPDHHERCFNSSDEILGKIAYFYIPDKLKKEISKEKKHNKDLKKISFFINNITSDSEHLDIFCRFLEGLGKSYLEKKNFQIDVIGRSKDSSFSYKFKKFINLKIIKVQAFQSKMSTYVLLSKICDYVRENNYSRIIFVGFPVYLPFFSRALPNKVAWWSLKYNIDVFPEVKIKFFQGNPKADKITVGNSIYHLIKNSFLSEKPKKRKMENFNKNRVIFYTINHETTINNPYYLNCVKELLNKIPNAKFIWTRDERAHKKKDLKSIENFFLKNNFSNRVEFLGQIDCKKSVKYGDIFLDAPFLASDISARVFAEGIPLVFFRHWISCYFDDIKKNNVTNKLLINDNFREIYEDWIKISKNKYFSSAEAHKFEKTEVSSEMNDYVKIAYKLATNENYFKNYSEFSIKLADQYFYSEDHARLFFDKIAGM